MIRAYGLCESYGSFKLILIRVVQKISWQLFWWPHVSDLYLRELWFCISCIIYDNVYDLVFNHEIRSLSMIVKHNDKIKIMIILKKYDSHIFFWITINSPFNWPTRGNCLDVSAIDDWGNSEMFWPRDSNHNNGN